MGCYHSTQAEQIVCFLLYKESRYHDKDLHEPESKKNDTYKTAKNQNQICITYWVLIPNEHFPASNIASKFFMP